MKTRKTKDQSVTPHPKGKVKLKKLALHKETVQNLSNQDAGAIRGGAVGAVKDVPQSKPFGECRI